ncbi:MAG: hypothetical protein V1934_00615 [Methanobacteriota archaeon]
MDLAALLETTLDQTQLYALAFLLGSFAVASLSDVRRMSAQREFLEVWLLVIFALLAYDIYNIYQGADWQLAAVRWILILVLSIASHEWTGLLFSLARADVAACASVAVLLSPVLIIVFYVVLKLLDFIMRPFLKVVGSGDAYPFMPVVLVGTGATAAFVIWAMPWLLALF